MCEIYRTILLGIVYTIIYIYMCKNTMLEMFLSLDMTWYRKYKSTVYL